jgi:hypothetical protein
MVWQSTSFYHSLLRKYVVVFGNYFNNITIKRNLEDGTLIADFKVPLQYAAKEKMIVRLNSDPNLDRPYSALLPVMSFELTAQALQYDANRKLNTVGRNVVRHDADKNKFKVLYNPVPYDINFSLFVYVKNQEDGHKIIEQILPFFTPDWTATVELIAEMNEIKDIPLVLTGVGMQDVYDNDFKERRMLIWTLQFVMHGWLYGPVRNKPMIKFTRETYSIATNMPIANAAANTTSSTNYMAGDIGSESEAGSPVDVMYTQPGLTPDGKPTTSMNESIDWRLIDVNDDFGFASHLEVNLLANSYFLYTGSGDYGVKGQKI